jgi:hypothetical protein
MPSSQTHGILADINNLMGTEVEAKLIKMFGEEQGKRVYKNGWARYHKKNENHAGLPLPSIELEGKLNTVLLEKLDEIENSLKGFQKLASTQHVLDLYFDILCVVFIRT